MSASRAPSPPFPADARSRPGSLPRSYSSCAGSSFGARAGRSIAEDSACAAAEDDAALLLLLQAQAAQSGEEGTPRGRALAAGAHPRRSATSASVDDEDDSPADDEADGGAEECLDMELDAREADALLGGVTRKLGLGSLRDDGGSTPCREAIMAS